MFGRKHFAPEGDPVGGGAPAAAPVVPAAAPVAAPAAAAPAAVVTPVAVVPAAPATAPAVDPTTDPAWIKGRLEREAIAVRNRTLQEFGITGDPAAAKAAIASAAAAAEATKSADVRATEATARALAAQSEVERYASITREHAGRMMAVLTADQQAAIRTVSPDTDPAGQLHAIGAFGPTWAAASNAAAAAETARLAAIAAAAPPPAAAPPAGAPPPASTAPGATMPVGGPTTSPPDHKSVYAASRAKNPFAAAAYGLEHASEVYRPKA
jgi:hypothetical protein